MTTKTCKFILAILCMADDDASEAAQLPAPMGYARLNRTATKGCKKGKIRKVTRLIIF